MAAKSTNGSKRPFWMHQVVEYILGGALVASGLQSPTPVIPSVLGAVVMLHSAITIGPVAAFRVIGRRTHRFVDVIVLAGEIIAGVQPWIDLESSTRVTILAIAAVHTFVWLQTNFAMRVKSPGLGADADRSTEIGRIAGRLVGNGVNAVRRQRDDR
jgi:hypothetical protein